MPDAPKRRVSPRSGAPLPESSLWKPGQSGNPSGKPKGTAEFASLMREAFEKAPPGGKRTLAMVLIDVARNPTHKHWGSAIKLCAAYGFGLPKRALDDETVKALAREMMEQAIEEARKKRALALQQEAENDARTDRRDT